jgi:D-xylose transport system ATP-binding protein
MTRSMQPAEAAVDIPPPYAAPNGRLLLSMRGICKRFGAIDALQDVSFNVHAGEVVALVGDNGAGKSTLVKTISGVGPADEGDIRFDDAAVRIGSPADASRIGIATVYQDLALCDNLDVVANLFLGRETVAGVSLDKLAMEKECRRLLDTLAVRTLKSVRAEVGTLSGGQRQTIAIARSMIGNPKLVILDEPTAALGVAQTEQVLNLVKRLKQNGMGVVLISHNLADVFAVADRIVVLRLGRNAGQFQAHENQRRAVVAAITGLADANVEAVA